MLRKHPNLMVWNTVRFNPVYALVEILIGVCSCRLVMLDNVEAPDSSTASESKISKPITIMVGMLSLLVFRAANWITINDGLARSCVFIPLWSLFMMQIHRETVKDIGSTTATTTSGPQGLTKLLNSKALVYLGSISFPIYIFHGPIGQVFYKKAIAVKLFGAVMSKKFGYAFFPVYMATVLAVSVLVKKYFLDNKAVQTKTKEVTGKLCELVE